MRQNSGYIGQNSGTGVRTVGPWVKTVGTRVRNVDIWVKTVGTRTRTVSTWVRTVGITIIIIINNIPWLSPYTKEG